MHGLCLLILIVVIIIFIEKNKFTHKDAYTHVHAPVSFCECLTFSLSQAIGRL